MPDFGFVGPSYVAQSIYQDDQELINWYPEVDPYRKERGVVALYPTPGIVNKTVSVNGANQAALIAGQPVRALWTLPGGNTLLAVCGNTLFSITTSYVATSVGTLNTSTGPVSMTDNGSSAYLCDGSATRYYFTYGTSTFSTISDGAFQSGTKVDIVDGFLIYNNPGTNQFACTSVTSVNTPSLSFGTKFTAPDNVMSIQVVNRNVFIIGEETTEAYIDTGAFPFPFQIIPGTSMQHGTIASFSVSRLGESFAMLSRDTRGQAVVIHMNGFTPTRISTHALEAAFNTYGTLSDAIAYTYQKAGHEFYVLTFPTQDVTWCYDLAASSALQKPIWHKRAWRDSNNVLHRHRGNCAALFNGDIVVGDWQNGKLYTLSDSIYTDDGAVLPCIRRAPHITTDLKRQFFHDFQIQFQPGVGISSGQGSDPQAMLIWSDDGGSTWSNQHWASIGKIGKYKNRAIWRRLGHARDRIFEVQVTDPVNRVVVSANLNASQGAA